MLKKKRFSGLFGASMTEIPSPGPEQASAAAQAGSNTNGYSSPQMLSNQGRQSSMSMLTNTTDGYFNNTNINNSNINGSGAGGMVGGVGDEDPAGNVLTRGEVHTSLENLKKLVIAAESYRELTTKLAKTTKQLGKCFKEYGDTKGMDSTYVMCLKSSANFYESFSEMETKLATCLQKDFELLQGNWEKHTKRVTKDEKAHDEILGDLDERIKKISLSYDKKNKRPDPNTALMSHEKYISTLSELQESIASAKKDHRNTVARRERYTHSLTAQIACRLSEAQFLAIERQLRGSGPSLLKIKEWAPYAGQDMPPPTLVTNGEPTIEIRSGSFEEYVARHTPSGGGNSASGSGAGNGMNGNSSYVPGAYQSQRMDPRMVSPTHSPAPITLTEMPQITLPPFAPMQQHLQQQQQQQQQQQLQQQGGGGTVVPGSQQSYYQSPTPTGLPTTMPVPNVATPAAPPPTTRLPTAMPEPKNYITPQQQQRQSIVIDPTPPQTITPQPTRVDKVLTTTTTAPPVIAKPSSIDHKVLVKEVGIVQPVTKAIVVEKPAPSTVVVADPVPVLTSSPPVTPGAFPGNTINTGITTVLTKESDPILKPVVVEVPGTVTKTVGGDRGGGGIVVNTTNLEGSWPEDHGSVSTKVSGGGSSATATEDGRSTTRSGDQALMATTSAAAAAAAKMDYFRESRALTTADEAADAAALDRYHRENYTGRYRYDEEGAGGVGAEARFRGPDDRDLDRDRDRHLDDMGPDDLYDDPYSPISGDHHSFYDDGGDDIARIEPRRYYDDDESQHSGSIPIQRGSDRDREYYTSRLRYEEREYDRSYQHYSSSMPAARRQPAYANDRERDRDRERDLDRGEWATAASALAAADDVSSMSGYAREQYPSSREYPTARPTLEDRERELDIINQKVAAAAAAAAANANGGGRSSRAGPGQGHQGQGPDPGYGPRRPASSAPGTVAHLRRRFSDLSVPDMSVPSGMTSPTQQQGPPRPRGMSGSGTQAIIQDTVRSRDRDSRYPPRASTPQSRAVAVGSAGGYQYERGGGGGGGANGRYSRAGGGGGGGHLSDYEDVSTRMSSRLVGDQRERRR
ncbi:hypothetical protein BGW39_011560 [Mortierella sp. 14UC]|nr:hypothetical protein BGW39_011560 [Mortierella sp. 14UC]